MCEKISYNTFFEAQSVINHAKGIGRRKNRHRASYIPKRAYKCPDCGKIHLTSKKKKHPKFN